MAEMGEYVVGACLEFLFDCEYVAYNVRLKGGGRSGLNELDVVGFNYTDNIVILCEVTTHIDGLLIGNYDKTYDKIVEKHKFQREYANKMLKKFDKVRYMYWSPFVRTGKLLERINKIEGIEFVFNKDYSDYVNKLKEEAHRTKSRHPNPFFRALQILEHLR